MAKKKSGYSGSEVFVFIMIVALASVALTAIWLSREPETNWGIGTVISIEHRSVSHDYLVRILVDDGYEKDFRWEVGGDVQLLYPGDRIEFRWLPSKWDAGVANDDPYGWRPHIVRYKLLERHYYVDVEG